MCIIFSLTDKYRIQRLQTIDQKGNRRQDKRYEVFTELL